jgi:hypothetical protein
MTQTPAFFVPAATSENQEIVYAEFAKMCDASIPPMSKRIYSITFIHDRDEWTATVGEHLQGIHYKTTRSRGEKIEVTQPLCDPAIVLAIFPGDPYMVVTDKNILEGVGSAWVNPFMAGNPTHVEYFT